MYCKASLAEKKDNVFCKACLAPAKHVLCKAFLAPAKDTMYSMAFLLKNDHV